MLSLRDREARNPEFVYSDPLFINAGQLDLSILGQGPIPPAQMSLLSPAAGFNELSPSAGVMQEECVDPVDTPKLGELSPSAGKPKVVKAKLAKSTAKPGVIAHKAPHKPSKTVAALTKAKTLCKDIVKKPVQQANAKALGALAPAAGGVVKAAPVAIAAAPAQAIDYNKLAPSAGGIVAGKSSVTCTNAYLDMDWGKPAAQRDCHITPGRGDTPAQ